MIKQVLILSFLLLLAPGMYAEKAPEPIHYDSSKVELRTSPKIETFKHNKDFIYDEGTKTPVTFLERILRYIVRFLEIIFDDRGAAPYIRYLVYLIVFVIVIFLLFKMNFGSVFFWNKKSGNNADLEFYDEDILHTDYDKLIEKALSDKNYRTAVRYLYLKLLKTLALKEIIHWEADKTNKDYRNEIRTGKYGSAFETLTRDYEYVWYGHFQINPDLFFRVNEEFKSIFIKLNV